MFIESGIVSEGSIKGVLSGKQYNKSVACHKTMYEALQRIRFEAFLDLHLFAFRSMIPWFFACDKVNYARYGSAYWLEMTSLEKTHPGLFVYILIIMEGCHSTFCN